VAPAVAAGGAALGGAPRLLAALMDGQKRFLLAVVVPMAIGIVFAGVLGAGYYLGWIR
jgi:hypothetical protein